MTAKPLRTKLDIFISNLRWRLFGWFSMPLQEFLRKRKIYWHDFFLDQCNRDFSCCMHKIPDEYKPLIQQVVRASEEQIPFVYYTKEAQ